MNLTKIAKMKKENKKSKRKKLLKILLGIGVTAAAIYAANKYIPGFNEKVVKPVQGFAKNMASDVKKSVLEKEEKLGNENNTKNPGKRFNKESIPTDRPRKNFNDKMNRCGNKNNRRECFEKKKF